MSDDDSPDESQHEDDGLTDSGDVRSLLASLSVRDVLTVVVAVTLVVGLAGVVSVALTPTPNINPHTEFYILGNAGTASDYPTNLTVSEQATVTVGVANHEQRRMTYTLVVRTDNRTLTTRTMTVARENRWERSVSYSLARPGRVEVQFHLYRGRDPGTDSPPYRNLRLWTNVSATEP